MDYLSAFGIDLSLEVDRGLRHYCRTCLAECEVRSTKGGGLQSNLHLLINRHTKTNVMLVQRVRYDGGEFFRAYRSDLKVPAALEHTGGVLCLGGDAHGIRVDTKVYNFCYPRRPSFDLMLNCDAVHMPPPHFNYQLESAVVDNRYVCFYYREETLDPREALEAYELLARPL